MTSTIRRRIGPLEVRFEGMHSLAPRAREWITAQVRDLPSDDPSVAGATLRMIFVDQPVPGPVAAIFSPLAPTDDGLCVIDGAGRKARFSLPDPTSRPTLVDCRMNLFAFEEWVLLPMLRLALEQTGGWMIRAAGVQIAGRTVAIAGPMRSGKSMLVLEVLRRGGRYLGDDWLYIDRAARVHPVLTKVTLRDGHRPQLGSRWPGGRAVLRRTAARLLRWAQARTSATFPAVATALERMATGLWMFGFTPVPLSSLDGTVGESRGITDLVFLAPEPVGSVVEASVPGLIAGLGDLDSRPNAVIEAAFLALRPGADQGRLFQPASAVTDAITTATASARTTVIRPDGPDWLMAAADDLAGPPGDRG